MPGAVLARRTVLAGVAALAACAGVAPAGRRLHGDDFRTGLGQWRAELERGGRVEAADGVLDIDVPGGATIWFLPELSGPVAIEYQAQAVAAGGPNDRVSDLNCFWMAQEPRAASGKVPDHRRSGKFADYDELLTYYVGQGGNHNSTTRFRRYTGTLGDRPMLPENDRRGAEDMLVANRWHRIQLTAEGGRISYACDGRTLFRFTDPEPLTHGHFAIRTVRSHLRIRDFRVRRL